MKTVRRFKAFLRGERGVSALEYAMLIGVVAVIVVAAIGTLGDDITTAIEAIGDQIAATNAGGAPDLNAAQQ